MDRPSPIRVQRYLGGIEYPASKQRLVEHATAKGADDDVKQLLARLPEHDYRTPAELSRALGRLE